MISGILKVAAVQPDVWLLGDSVIPETMGWTWVWQVQPAADGRQTRLVNRTRIQTAGPDNPVANVMIGLGGFIMNQRSMHGLKAHAEGWSEPGYEEPLEIVLWFLTLAVGLVAAGLFVVRRRWQPPLMVALAAIILLMVLTFVQPAVWLRVVLDATLIAALVWAWRSTTALSPMRMKAREIAFG